MGIKDRLSRLEEAAGLNQPEASREAAEKQRWLTTARMRRAQYKGDWRVRDVIGLLRSQGRLGATTEDLRELLLAWRPPLDRIAIERGLAKTIYDQEEGTESMVCPAAWREAFAGADELRERYAAVPDGLLAQWAIMQHDREEGELRDVEEDVAAESDAYGITDELLLKAVGPDAEEIPPEELIRRLTADVLADFYYGEQGYRVQQHIDRLMQERPWPCAIA